MNNFSGFIQSLKILSASADEQVAYLNKMGVAPCADELALTFDDMYQPLKGRLDEGAITISEQALDKLQELDDLLDSMGGPANADLWHIHSLSTESWNKVRSLAGEILHLLSA